MSNDFNLNCPVPLSDHATVQMAHGGGGRLMRNLIESCFCRRLQQPLPRPAVRGRCTPLSPLLSPLASPTTPPCCRPPAARLAFTTDSFVVNPLFFPGGDIGKLAVCGTVNDLAMAGARPAYLSAGFILEEGLPMETLRRVVASMAEAARAAGVRIVTGDTKVVDRGKGDGIFINTAGVGWVPQGVEISPARVRPGRCDPAERRPRPARHGDHVGPRGAAVSRGRWRAIVPRWPDWSKPCSPPAPTSIAFAI